MYKGLVIIWTADFSEVVMIIKQNTSANGNLIQMKMQNMRPDFLNPALGGP